MKKFLMMIGTQRGGSTMLHHALNISTDITMHPIKELHYFDTKHKVRPEQTLRNTTKRRINGLFQKLEKHPGMIKKDEVYLSLKANFMLHSEELTKLSYLDLFHTLNEKEYIGECTPEYMLLGKKGLNDIKQQIDRDVKILLIVRNPVQRFLSAVKLLNRSAGLNLDNSTINDFIRDMLNEEEESHFLQQQDLFNNYKHAINLYTSLFTTNFKVVSYDDFSTGKENLFNELNDFLDTEINHTDFIESFNEKKNSQGESLKIEKDVLDRLEKRYRKNLNYINEYLGRELLL